MSDPGLAASDASSNGGIKMANLVGKIHKMWIRLPVTAVVAGPNFKPGRWDKDLQMMVDGNYDQVYITPWTPFEIEESEGRALIAKHGGEEVKNDVQELWVPSEKEMQDSIPSSVIVDDRPAVRTR
jgi:hypothetical protein